MTNRPTYAIISDIHGNLEALNAVLEDAAAHRVTSYVCLGDIVGYNADPAECLEKIRALDCVAVKGNHDHFCSFDDDLNRFNPVAADAIGWTRRQLSADQQTFLADLKLTEKVENFTVVHSTLDMPEMWGYIIESLEAEASMNYQMTTVCFFGHTHRPMAFIKDADIVGGSYSRLRIDIEKKYLINAGSVGQPRDRNPRASYAIFDVEACEVELRRVEYDIGATQAKIRRAGLPESLAARLSVGV